MFKMFKPFKCDFVQSYKSCEGERDARKGEKIDRYIGIEREMRKRVEKQIDRLRERERKKERESKEEKKQR